MRPVARVELDRKRLELGLEAVASLLQLRLDLDRPGRTCLHRRTELRDAEEPRGCADQKERDGDDQRRGPGGQDERKRDAGRDEQSGGAEERERRGGDQDRGGETRPL